MEKGKGDGGGGQAPHPAATRAAVHGGQPPAHRTRAARRAVYIPGLHTSRGGLRRARVCIEYPPRARPCAPLSCAVCMCPLRGARFRVFIYQGTAYGAAYSAGRGIYRRRRTGRLTCPPSRTTSTCSHLRPRSLCSPAMVCTRGASPCTPSRTVRGALHPAGFSRRARPAYRPAGKNAILRSSRPPACYLRGLYYIHTPAGQCPFLTRFTPVSYLRPLAGGLRDARGGS